jgi:hypothetical protein
MDLKRDGLLGRLQADSDGKPSSLSANRANLLRTSKEYDLPQLPCSFAFESNPQQGKE